MSNPQEIPEELTPEQRERGYLEYRLAMKLRLPFAFPLEIPDHFTPEEIEAAKQSAREDYDEIKDVPQYGFMVDFAARSALGLLRPEQRIEVSPIDYDAMREAEANPRESTEKLKADVQQYLDDTISLD